MPAHRLSRLDLSLSRCQAVGATDSEHAFCWLLHQIRQMYPTRPTDYKLERPFSELFASLRELGVFNALLSDGRTLYTSCSTKLCYIRRVAPFGRASLIDEDMEVDFAAETSPDDKVVIIESQPLTRNETWTHFPVGSTAIFRDGDLIRQYE